MKKSTMIGLVKGNKIQHKKSGLVLTVITVTDEGVQCEEKFISISNCTRWFDLVEQPVEEKTVEEKVVEDKPVEPIEPTNTSEKTVVNENHEDHTGEANSKVIEGKNSMDEINNILITHNCYLKKMKQYEAVRSDRTTGTLIYIRFAKEGGYHFDVSQKTWSKLTKDYASWLIENFGACIKDKTRKLYRISCNNLEIFQVLLLTALS